ncbi:MAG: phenylalanine--tRNA ligase subunit beta [Lachnospiraceae bacterium]|nr:phenylalanine--tRNA ligase subunit beta [Lachnospiraceae bacterium]
MLLPLSWLREYVDIDDITPQELEKKLFSCGFEVEEKTELGQDISHVVVGLVESCEPIPDTHLSVCQVNAGEHGTMQVCCGADNVHTGGKYPLALPGATVYATAKDHKTVEGVATIKAGKLRGYESNGMLCSGVELGLNEDLYPGADYFGLLVLPDDAPVGADVKPLVGLDDWIFDVGITANRADCQSIFGMAREVAAVLEKPLKEPALDYHPTDAVQEGFQVTVEAPDICPRYIAHWVYDVTIGESPAWMKRRLALVGLQSISNVVDITNYILMELGQPMHAFDGAYLEGNAICVRRAKENETIVTLDEQTYELNSNNLVICDGVKAVALGGVMGGLNSEIRDTTATVMLEAAKFARDNIRKTSRSLGKRSDSSARYEKGVDEYTTVMAMKRALHLIEELGCGKVTSTHVDVNTGNSVEPREMKASVEKVNGVLGITVPNEDILRILTNLNFAPTIDGDELTIQIPAYREDMESYPDISEEIIRMYGYDHIVPTFMPTAKVTMGGKNLKQKGELALKRAVCATGAYECMHYSFFSPSDLDLMRFAKDAPERQAIPILNPINEDMSLMRTTLAPQMIEAMARNQKRGTLEGRLFELANRFIPKSLPLTDYPDEKKTLCVGVFGEKESFFTLKGIAEAVAKNLYVTFSYAPTTKPFLHPYQAAEVTCNGEAIGYLGTVSYEIQNELSMRTPAFVMELDVDILEKYYENRPTFEPLPKFEEQTRDLALVMDKDMTCGRIEEAIVSCSNLIREIRLFDVYEGGQVPAGKKSMAFSVTFRPKDEELTNEKVDQIVAKILRKLEHTMNVTLRS